MHYVYASSFATVQVLSIVSRPNELTVYVNGSSVLRQSVPAMAFYGSSQTSMMLGGVPVDSLDMDGDIFDFLIFDRALGREERGEVEAYLQARHADGVATPVQSAPTCPRSPSEKDTVSGVSQYDTDLFCFLLFSLVLSTFNKL